MKINAYCMFDKVACSAGNIFLSRTDESIARDIVRNTPKDKVDLSDYTLYKIGVFDDSDCTFSPCPKESIPLNIKE